MVTAARPLLFDRELIEHVAAIADEHAGSASTMRPDIETWWRALEQVCDEMLAGIRLESELPSWIRQYELEDACAPDHARRSRA